MAAPLEMKMAAITSTDNDALNKALIRLGWTQSDLARRSKISINIISDIINLEKPPTKQEANAMQRAFAKAGEYIDVLEHWSATFAIPESGDGGRPCLNIRFESLWDHAEAMQLAAPERDNEGLEEAVEMVLSRLSNRAYEVLKRRFWKGESLTQVGNVIGVSRHRVRQIESHAFQTLKHPAWVRKLGAYMPRHLKQEPSSHPRRRKHWFKNDDANRRPKTRRDMAIRDES
jgi:RNA polymerase sigma factor (sigma-70 family)